MGVFSWARYPCTEREFFIDNLLVRIYFIVVMTRWTGLAAWKFEFPFPCSLTFTFLDVISEVAVVRSGVHSRASYDPL